MDCDIFVVHGPMIVAAAGLKEAVHDSSPHPVHVMNVGADASKGRYRVNMGGLFMTLIDSFVCNISELRTEIADAHHWQRHTSLLCPSKMCPTTHKSFKATAT